MRTTDNARWYFLTPWLDVLGDNMKISAQSGWRHGLGGAAPLAYRLENLVISVEAAARMDNHHDAKKYLDILRRAMTIVALALRVEPRVWMMLRGYLLRSDPRGEAIHVSSLQDEYYFRDEDVEVAFMMDTYWIGFVSQKTKASWQQDPFWQPAGLHSQSLGAETYDPEAVMRCYRWLMQATYDEHEETDADDAEPSAAPSRAKYFADLAEIQRLNVYRIDLNRPIPVSFTVYFGNYGNDDVVEAIADVVESPSTRFQLTDLTLRIHRDHVRQPALFQRIAAIPGAHIDSVGHIYPDTRNQSSLARLTASDAASGAVPREISLWLGDGWELPHASNWLWSCRVKKLVLMSFLFDLRGELSKGCVDVGSDGERGDVERLELEQYNGFDKYCVLTVDPIKLAAELWGRPALKCRLDMSSPAYSEVVQRLEEVEPSSEAISPSTEWVCIRGNDPSVVFLVIPPSGQVVCASAADIVLVSQDKDETPRYEPPPWLGKVRSLKVSPHTRAGVDSIASLSWLMTSLVSLELHFLNLDESQKYVPAIIASLPRSLLYLRVDAAMEDTRVVEALLLAFSHNNLRVRSLQLSNRWGFDVFELLLQALSDPTNAIACRLEELRMVQRSSFIENERLGSLVADMLERNDRLNYVHVRASMYTSTRMNWWLKVGRFHATPVRNREGKRLPVACKLALLSVVRRQEIPLDRWVAARVFGYASSNLMRVVQIG